MSKKKNRKQVRSRKQRSAKGEHARGPTVIVSFRLDRALHKALRKQKNYSLWLRDLVASELGFCPTCGQSDHPGKLLSTARKEIERSHQLDDESNSSETDQSASAGPQEAQSDGETASSNSTEDTGSSAPNSFGGDARHTSPITAGLMTA
jgi:hypothetical protein